MSHIFISYASEDAEFARRLAGAFENLGWSVWWDKHIPPGMDYAQVVEKAIDDAHSIVVLWSQHSIRSRWVQTEAAEGADRGVAATVIIDDTSPADIPLEFRRLQAVDLADWQQDKAHPGFERLANRIRSMRNEAPLPLSSEATRARPASWKEAMTTWGSGGQALWRGGAMLAALIALWMGLDALQGGGVVRLSAAAVLVVLAPLLLHFGRRPA